MKGIDFVNDLKKWREKYDELRGLIADQVNDDQIEEAQTNFGRLLHLKRIITEMENIEINFNTTQLADEA